MHAVHVLYLFSMSFFVSDHQDIMFSARKFAEYGCPKCSTSTACLFSSFGTTTFSPANSKPNSSLISVKTGENSSGALFVVRLLLKLGFFQIFFGFGVLEFQFFNHMFVLNIVYRLFFDIITL